MSRHNRIQSVFNQILIDHTISLVPFLTAHGIHTVCHMLVAEIKSVSRKVLCRTAETWIRMCTVHIGFRHLCHLLRFISISAKADYRIFPIIHNIAHRCERQVTPNSCRFLIRHIPHLIRIICISRSADLCLPSDRRPIHTCAVSAALRITCDDKRNLTVLL